MTMMPKETGKPSHLEGLAELTQTGCHPRVAQGISDLLTSGQDFDLYKVNAFRLARVWGVDRADALRGFLFATRLGLFVPMS
jgi:hypothetical protein